MTLREYEIYLRKKSYFLRHEAPLTNYKKGRKIQKDQDDAYKRLKLIEGLMKVRNK